MGPVRGPAHDDLVAPEDAEVHAALSIDGELFWEVRLAIDAGTGREAHLEVATVELVEPIVEGASVVFHLHNHGQNSYNLVDVRREGGAE